MGPRTSATELAIVFPDPLRLAVFGDAARRAALIARVGPALPWVELEAGDALEALRQFARAHANDEVILVDARATLPARALERLLKAATASSAAVISPLCDDAPELSPLPIGAPARAVVVADVDAGAWCYGARRVIDTRAWSGRLSLWRREALAWLLAHPRWTGGPLPDGLAGACCDHLYVGAEGATLAGPAPLRDPRYPPPASELANLRARFAPLPAARAPLAGLDARPVVLHILHGWGGGAEAFVRDLARADEAHHHLVLQARGQYSRRAFGEALELTLPTLEAPALRRWPLGRPIAATAIAHEEYRAVLAEVLREWRVDAVMVSSLIGHSLEALATGLPTIVVAHDYYPLWPILHQDFGDGDQRYDRDALRVALAACGDELPFAERDAEAWWTLRAAYVDALRGARPTLVAPLPGVRDNACRIEPALRDLSWRIVPHGLRPFPESRPAPSPPARARPRVLVPGRIAGGKGEQLLAPVIERLRGEMDFYLLGAGPAAERFFGVSGVHIEMNYARDELPALIARIAPDVALLPGTVAETFSYTLSELRALALPVVATRLGSYVERVADGVEGWLTPPEAEAMAETLRRVLADREALTRVRDRLRAEAPRDTPAMARDYAAVLSLPSVSADRYFLRELDTVALARADAEQRAALLEAEHARQARLLREQQTELEARAAWVARVEREGRERLEAQRRDADALYAECEADRDAAREAHAQLAREFEERSAWALALDRRRAELEREFFFPPNRVFLKLTRILRRLASPLSRMLDSLLFRARRALGLARRAWSSLRSRGLRATWQRAVRYLRGERAALEAPDTPGLDVPFAPFVVPGSDTPVVSIVIPVYNHFRHTLTCLRSLAQHPGTVPFEVIVVDDCSSDETPTRLPQISGIRAHRNAENLGFIGACNAGAALARGEYVLLLNNDTAVRPGWLEALTRTFAERPDCGLVGAKLIYPDGRLQEAGGIVFADASGWNYGRFDDPAAPAYNFVREADYCSGAAIMLKRALFERFEGFDTRYKPAYYEDTDLAFRVRKAGLKVYYQPAAEVVHFEGVSSGTDVTTGTKRYQVINQEKFRERWAEVLPRQPKPGSVIARARVHRARRWMLIADACTPTPDQDSGSVRMVNLLRLLLAQGWHVVFFNENLSHDGRYTEALQQLGVEVLYRPQVHDIVAWLAEHGALFDAVLLSRHYIAAPLLPLVRRYARHARVAFDTVDLHYLREEREARLANRADLLRAAQKTKSQELRLIRECDVTLVVSPVEQALIREEVPAAHVELLSNVHEVAGVGRPFGERRDLFFVGGFQHPPNVDAVCWFVAEIWPAIAARLPEATFHIIGSRLLDEVRALDSESARVRVHGFVEDLAPFLDGCRLSVAPLRYGAGVKGKVNQSMAHGQPVVATPMAVEGMHIREGEDVMVATTPAEFADAVVRVYQDQVLWEQLSRNGLANVARHFSFDAALTALARIFPA